MMKSNVRYVRKLYVDEKLRLVFVFIINLEPSLNQQNLFLQVSDTVIINDHLGVDFQTQFLLQELKRKKNLIIVLLSQATGTI